MDKVKTIKNAFETYAFSMDDGPILTGCSVEDNGVSVTWTDGNCEFDSEFDNESLENAQIIIDKGGIFSHIVITDNEDYPTKVEFFSLKPVNPFK